MTTTACMTEQDIISELNLLPAAVKKDKGAACDRVQTLLTASQETPAMLKTFITHGVYILPDIAAEDEKDAMVADYLVQSLLTASQENPAMLETFIKHGVAIVPPLAVDHSWVASKIVQALLTVSRETPAMLEAFITQGMTILPAVVAEDDGVASNLVQALLTASQVTPEVLETFITQGVAILPVVAAECGWAASELAQALLSAQGVTLSPTQGFACAQFVLSSVSPSSDRRTVITFSSSEKDQEPHATVGCFHGTIDALKNASKKTHREEPLAQDHYTGICAVANAMIEKKDEGLSFVQAVLYHKQNGTTWPKLRMVA